MAFADPATVSHVEVEQVRARVAAFGLSIPSVQSLVFGKPDLQLFGDTEARGRLLGHLVRMASLAEDLGARTMVFGSPASRLRRGMALDVANELAVDFFMRLGDLLPGKGPVVTIEPNPPIYAGCDWLNHTAEALEFVRRVDHPRVRLQLDTGAMVSAIEAAQPHDTSLLNEALGSGAHLHISAPGLLPIRSGDSIQQRIARDLLRAGLAESDHLPWVSIEMKGGPDPISGIQEAVAAVRAWYPINMDA